MASGVKLTKRSVEALRAPPGRDLFAWDSELPGFAVRVKASGVRSYLVKYQAGRRARWYTLGRHGRMTTDEARRAARQVLAAADRGEDPAEQRRKARGEPRVSDLTDAYLEHLREKRKASTLTEAERLFRVEISPRLGRRQVSSISREDVERLHRELGKRAPVVANRAVAYLGAALRHAQRSGLDVPNPCEHLTRYRERKRDRFLTAPELARLGQALADVERESTELPTALLAVRLLALTGMRRGEVLGLRWNEVDFEHRCLRLSDSKSGAKVVPLSAPALELLAKAPREEGNPYVIAGKLPGRPLVGLPKIWQRLRQRAGLLGVRLHDLRHSHASIGVGLGFDLYLVGKLLGHADQATTQRYAHLAEDPVRAAGERIASEIAAALEGRPAGSVVTIESKR